MTGSVTPAPTSHWPEYLIEAWALGTFMIAAGVCSTLLEYPGSALHRSLADPGLRRALAGVAMGLTAVAIIYSPWGKRSGAHMNPSVTLAFLSLGKVHGVDALFFVLAQFVGGVAGVLVVLALFGAAFSAPPVSYAATVPGGGGAGIAFAAEFLISAGLIFVILRMPGSGRAAPFHGSGGRRLSRGDLYQPRSTAFRHEHESGAHLRLRCPRSHVGTPLDLLHRARRRHARRGSALSGALSPRGVRQARLPRRRTLHPLRLRATVQRTRGPLNLQAASMVPQRYDAIIVGSGAGGAAAAYRLVQGGLRVVLLEKGDPLPIDGSTLDVRRVVHEGKFLSREEWLDGNGGSFKPEEHFNVGGKTKWYGAALVRFSEREFRADEAHGCRAWPIGLAALEPYYGEAERLLRVRPFDQEPDLACILGRLVRPGGPLLEAAPL